MSQFRKGQKVSYPHGRGRSVGTYHGSRDDGLFIIVTKNGSTTARRPESVSKAE